MEKQHIARGTWFVQDVADALESFAPLPLQEDYDNAGLQIGITGRECSGALLCLDVTESVILDAARQGLNMVISHHPLLFRGLKCIADRNYVERCVRLAITRGIAIYSAHTNLDNARGGVNFEIAARLGLGEVEFLQPLPHHDGGSGVIGTLPTAVDAKELLQYIKQTFGVACLNYTEGPQRPVRRVALCGGAGDFLIDEAVRKGADIFLTGEMGYHRYFGHHHEIWLATLGHYQSEQFTVQLMHRILAEACPGLHIEEYQHTTNPILYM